jgi:hypothetical protein
MWHRKTELQFDIKIGQLMSGVSKDYLMEIVLPACAELKLDDNHRNIEVLVVNLNGSYISNGEKKPFVKS